MWQKNIGKANKLKNVNKKKKKSGTCTGKTQTYAQKFTYTYEVRTIHTYMWHIQKNVIRGYC